MELQLYGSLWDVLSGENDLLYLTFSILPSVNVSLFLANH